MAVKMETMQSGKLAGKKPGVSTQQHLDVAEIREGVVVMKDGTLRGILLVSSINFALKSEDEQTGLVQSYVGFLNSLDFPLQIVIQSRRLDIDNYLERLQAAAKTQTNELLRAQIADYRDYIKELVEMGNIMSKRFFVVVPYSPLGNKVKTFWQRFREVLSPAAAMRMKEAQFQDRAGDLDKRVSLVAGGLSSVGLQVTQLDTQGLIELFYNVYNPDIFLSEKMKPLSEILIQPE